MKMRWHQKEINEVIEELTSSLQGLSHEEAERRLEKYGPNELKEKERKTPLMMFLDQFKDFMIIVLLCAAIVSGVIGEASDTVAIMVIVFLNAIIGFIQEYRAEKAMEALKKLAAPAATVIRGGSPSDIQASGLVPGDVAVLEAGKVVPADMRVIEAVRLKVEEAPLTGESVSVEKHTGALDEEMLPLGDRKNMLYKGTTISYGRGRGIVVATGMATELGRIAAMLQEEEEVRTPLQKRLTKFGQKLAIAILAICAIVFTVGIMRGAPPVLMLLTAISLAVAAIPEALPAVVTISLALGARKMVKQNALIRKLPAVETLGSVTYICSDKTGTLTMNRMTVEQVYVDGRIFGVRDLKVGTGQERQSGPDPRSVLLSALALNSDAREDALGGLAGDPTEVALYAFARANGFEKGELEKTLSRVAEIPFDSGRKCMTTFHKWSRGQGVGGVSGKRNRILEPLDPGALESFQYISFTKGATEALVEKSNAVLTSSGLVPIDRDQVLGMNERMAADGLRVMGIAVKIWDRLPEDVSPENGEAGLTFVGLAGMMDPPREEARDAVSRCKASGIKAVMITGDHPLTAQAIARRLGILEGDAKAVITGRELEQMPSAEFGEKVEQIRVYARVAPEQKVKIVKALQDRGQFVAMTGDGVNDAPALRRADIGVAMGVTGTDVAKEAADLILLDDNFATIVKAVKEGRKIYDNIRKFVTYLLTTNSGEIWTLFLAPLAGLPVPLLPIHILWINLMTDGLPALALSVEPEEGDVMRRPPRHPEESIFAYGLGIHAVWVGLLMAGIVLFVQAWSITTGHAHWQTMVFTVLCLTQFGHVLAVRSEKESLFTIGLFSNKALLGAVVLGFVLQLSTVYVPVLNPVFKTAPLTAAELVITIVLSSAIFFVVEFEKLLKRLRSKNGSPRNNSEVL
jgi:Ca2+-transporting ATPase